MTLYVANVKDAEFHLKAHLFSDCSALRGPRGFAGARLREARPAQELHPGMFSELLRDLCKRCQKRAAALPSPLDSARGDSAGAES
jgi:hypothetical protein